MIVTENALVHEIFDISRQKCAGDITTRPPVSPDNALRDTCHIQVKGHAKGAINEITSSSTQAKSFIFSIVLVDSDQAVAPYNIKHLFKNESEFGTFTAAYYMQELLGYEIKPEENL